MPRKDWRRYANASVAIERFLRALGKSYIVAQETIRRRAQLRKVAAKVSLVAIGKPVVMRVSTTRD